MRMAFMFPPLTSSLIDEISTILKNKEEINMADAKEVTINDVQELKC